VTARELSANLSEVVVLHGDIHRGNVLDFGHRGWLASDPKGLVGERYCDLPTCSAIPTWPASRGTRKVSRRSRLAVA
jgi:streptomycin 6-kinase